jgi:hypothetical protein
LLLVLPCHLHLRTHGCTELGTWSQIVWSCKERGCEARGSSTLAGWEAQGRGAGLKRHQSQFWNQTWESHRHFTAATPTPSPIPGPNPKPHHVHPIEPQGTGCSQRRGSTPTTTHPQLYTPVLHVPQPRDLIPRLLTSGSTHSLKEAAHGPWDLANCPVVPWTRLCGPLPARFSFQHTGVEPPLRHLRQ